MSTLVHSEKMPHSVVKLTVELSQAEVKAAVTAALTTIQSEVQLAGFRKGKAPVALVRETVGQTRIAEEALRTLLAHSYPEAVKAANIIPLKEPAIALTDPVITDGELKPVTYTAQVEVYPTVTIDDYRSIRVSANTDPVTVTDQEVDAVLTEVREGIADRVDKTGSAALGDVIEIDFSGKENGVELTKLVSKQHPVWLGKTELVPGFTEGLVGMQVGEIKTLKITYPTDFAAADLAGKTIEFTITAKKLQQVVLPDSSDALAAKVGFATLLEMRTKFRANLLKEKEQARQAEIERLVIEALIAKTTVEVPDSLVEQQITQLVASIEADVERMGGNFLQYLTHRKLTPDGLRDSLRDRAEKDVMVGLALASVAKDEGQEKKASAQLEGEQEGQTLLRQALDTLVVIATAQQPR